MGWGLALLASLRSSYPLGGGLWLFWGVLGVTLGTLRCALWWPHIEVGWSPSPMVGSCQPWEKQGGREKGTRCSAVALVGIKGAARPGRAHTLLGQQQIGLSSSRHFFLKLSQWGGEIPHS